MPRVRSAPITSPISSANNIAARGPAATAFKDPELNELITDPLSLAEYDTFILRPKGAPMTPLQQKLNQLSLTTMSHQLDQTIADAASKNLSAAEALEALLDRELEARNTRSIERRFRLSRCKPSTRSTASTSNIIRAADSAKVASSAFWISASSKKAPASLDLQSRRRKNFFGQDRRLASL